MLAWGSGLAFLGRGFGLRAEGLGFRVREVRCRGSIREPWVTPSRTLSRVCDLGVSTHERTFAHALRTPKAC